MPDYRRVYLEGGTYFFTVVTYDRRPIFADDAAVELLSDCLRQTGDNYPFRTEAFVILPDHLHTIWILPEGDADFSTRWRRIKAGFSRRYSGHATEDVSRSRSERGERTVWQRRFWEHVIRDQGDFSRHCDYIHYNPVKHGLANSPSEWAHGSFGEFVEKGLYPEDWGREPGKELLSLDLE